MLSGRSTLLLQLPVQCRSICLLLPGIPQLTHLRAACMVSWQAHLKGLPSQSENLVFCCQLPCLKQKVCFRVPKRRGASMSVLLLTAVILIAPILIGTSTTLYKLDSDSFKIGMRRFLTVRLPRLQLRERETSYFRCGYRAAGSCPCWGALQPEASCPQEVQGDRVPCNPLLCSSPPLPASTARPGSSHSRSPKYMKLLNFHH